MSIIQYDFLGAQPEHIATIAAWHQQEWQHISPQLTTEKRIALYSSYASSPGIPCCIVASQQGRPLGSASLINSDMEERPELSPWLASVYTHPDARCQGIATRLIEHCLEVAQQCKIQRLYLFTPDQAGFYQKRGWHLMEHCQYHGEQVDIMYYKLGKI